jgi:phospholipid transport system substrate-binding protein
MVKKYFYLWVAVLFLNQMMPSFASPDAKGFIEDLGRRAINSLTKPDVSQNQLESKFKSLLDEGFDVPGIARFVMGRYWKQMTPEQQTQFIPIFKHRLTRSYANRFQQYQGVIFTVKDAREEGNDTIVTSTIQKPGGPITPVDWRVQGGKIYDVKVEGVSMSITIRDEYSALVQSKNGNIGQFLQAIGGS